MNILYINEDNYGGGSSKALVIFAREMKKRGHNVFVVSRNDDGFIIDQLINNGAKIYLCPIHLPLLFKQKNPLAKIKFVLRAIYRWIIVSSLIKKIIVKDNIDIVHANTGILYYGYLPCRKLHVPHILHHREFFDKFLEANVLFPCKRFFKYVLNSEDNYNICITKGVLNYLGLEENKNNRVIYDGIISNDKIANCQSHHKSKYFLFAGRIERNKAPHILIKAFSEFHKKHTDYKIKIAGIYYEDDIYYKECAQIINKFGLDDYVEFLGFRKDLDNLMQHATAVVVTSEFEGFGFIMVEGMLNRSLIIGRNTTGTKEQFDIGLKQTGKEIGFRFTNEEELYKAMVYAVETDTTEICERAYKVVCENYTIERCMNETEDFYYHVIDDFKKRK